jgi:hypothetical protein
MDAKIVVLAIIGYLIYDHKDPEHRSRIKRKYKKTKDKASRYYYYRIKNRKYYKKDYSGR